jgi:hypothetical protein
MNICVRVADRFFDPGAELLHLRGNARSEITDALDLGEMLGIRRSLRSRSGTTSPYAPGEPGLREPDPSDWKGTDNRPTHQGVNPDRAEGSAVAGVASVVAEHQVLTGRNYCFRQGLGHRVSG